MPSSRLTFNDGRRKSAANRTEELEPLRDYRREVMFSLHESNTRRMRAAMRRKVNLWHPEIQRNTKATQPIVHQARQKSDVIRRVSMPGRRLAKQAKEQTKLRVRRREPRERTADGVDGSGRVSAGEPTPTDGSGGVTAGEPEAIDGTDKSVPRRPGPID